MPKRPTVAPGIDKRADGTYRARITHQGKQHLLGYFRTITDARAAVDIARGERARGVFVPPAQRRREAQDAAAEQARADAAKAFTVNELAAEWITWQERRGLKRATVYTRERHFAHHIAPTFGGMAVADVTPQLVADWYDALLAASGPGTARGPYQAMNALFAYAAGTARALPGHYVKRIETNPCQLPDAAKHRAVKTVPRKVATADEIASLAAGMPDDEQLAVLLGAWCGLRIGEVLGLRRRDFYTTPAKADGEPPLWWVRIERQVQSRGGGLREDTVKTAAGNRVIPIASPLVAALTGHLLKFTGTGEDAPLFPREARGLSPMHPNRLRLHFVASRDRHNAAQAARTAPKLDGFTFHHLRHTGLTRIGQAGATLAELQRFGGHADVRTAQQYQHADLDRLAMLAAGLNEIKVPGEEPAKVVSLRARRQRS